MFYDIIMQLFCYALSLCLILLFAPAWLA